MLTVGGLCSGVGMVELAFMLAGFKVRWLVEKDPFCQQIIMLRRRQFFPGAELFEDVYGVGKHNLSPVDVVTAGFPCQPASHNGKRKGIHDERWIWDGIARIIDETQPRAVFLENVDGIVSANDGAALRCVFNDLSKSGYDAEWACLRADTTVGAPHQRERWICIATRNRTVVGDAAGEVLEGQRALRIEVPQARHSEEIPQSSGDERGRFNGTTQPRLGRNVFDGLAFGLDESGDYRYWANYRNRPPHTYEPPRVSPPAPFKKERVAAIGNGAVMPMIYKLACVVREKITTR